MENCERYTETTQGKGGREMNALAEKREVGIREAERLTRAAKLRFESLEDLKIMIAAQEYEIEMISQKAELSEEDGLRLIELEKDTLQKRLEVRRLMEAIAQIQNEPYVMSITGRYIAGQRDEETAEQLFCDVSTVRRNRKKLLRKIAEELYCFEEAE